MQISEVETFCIGKQTQLFFLKRRGASWFFFYGEKYNCSVVGFINVQTIRCRSFLPVVCGSGGA